MWDLTANSCSCELVPEVGVAIRSITVAGDSSLVIAGNHTGARLVSEHDGCSMVEGGPAADMPCSQHISCPAKALAAHITAFCQNTAGRNVVHDRQRVRSTATTSHVLI